MIRNYLNLQLKTLLLLYIVVFSSAVSAQQLITQIGKLQTFSEQKRLEAIQQRTQAETQAQAKGWPIRLAMREGQIIELQGLNDFGMPIYYTTHNVEAAQTTRADKLWATPFNLSGQSYTLGEWDGGAVLTSHQEFVGRVTQVDSSATLSDHATHVAGTLVASGIYPSAKGMAYAAFLNAYDWNQDESEMATAAANGLELSNHSYGFIAGWEYDYRGDERWAWFGAFGISTEEDWQFGYYTSSTQNWDQIAYDAPYYLIVKSAGTHIGQV